MQVDNRTEASHGENSPLFEKTLGVRTAFKGHAVTVDVIDIELPDGRRAVRECVRHKGAVAILARRPDGRFVFVRQYRKCIEQAYVEVVAGGIEEGEAPDVTAHREMREESGYLVRRSGSTSSSRKSRRPPAQRTSTPTRTSRRCSTPKTPSRRRSWTAPSPTPRPSPPGCSGICAGNSAPARLPRSSRAPTAHRRTTAP